MRIAVVSVIMPVYNGEQFLAEAIESVIDQTFKNWELLVVNDGSTDKSCHIAMQFASADNRIKVISQPNKKLAGARNTGFKAAEGNWIAFLDADDIWQPDKLSLQISSAHKADIIYTSGMAYNVKNNVGVSYPTVAGFFSGSEMFMQLFHKNIIPVLSVMMKREVIEKLGYQDDFLSAVGGCEDWDYWLRAARNGMTFYGLTESLFTYRIYEQSMSGDSIRMKLSEMYALYNNLDHSLISQRDLKKRFYFLAYSLIHHLIVQRKYYELSEVYRMLRAIDGNIIYKAITRYLQSSNNINLNLVKLLMKVRMIML